MPVVPAEMNAEPWQSPEAPHAGVWDQPPNVTHFFYFACGLFAGIVVTMILAL